MTFSPVIPTTYQDDRVQLNAALVAIVQAFIVSENYAIGRVAASEVPDSFTGEGPLIIVGDINEEVVHDWQIRTTTFTGQLLYVDWLTSRGEYNDRVNRYADRMRDLFTYNRSTVNSDAVLEQTAFQEGQLRQGQLVFGAPAVIWKYVIQEGYQ